MTYKVTISDNGVTVNHIIESVNIETACEAMRAEMIDAESIADGNEGVEMRDKWTEAIMEDSASCSLRGESQDAQAWAKVTIEPAAFTGWGIVGEPLEGVLVQTGNGIGIDVTGYSAGDYWRGNEFLGPDAHGIVPMYGMGGGAVFPADAKQYPYMA